VVDGSDRDVKDGRDLLVRADGLLRLGLADRRGELFEMGAPRGVLRLGVPASAVDPATRRVSLADGTVLPYDALLLATGEWPDAISGWRRTLLEPALAPLLATGDNATTSV
jgi:NADPH-dependent 2,4-dienoyl-CoA reductase/sulfur reductase-like enzyme